MAAPTSSNSGACSKTCGSKPNCLKASAALKPQMPPPMIAIRIHEVSHGLTRISTDQTYNNPEGSCNPRLSAARLFRVELSPRIQTIEVQNCIEDEEIAAFCLAAPEWIG